MLSLRPVRQNLLLYVLSSSPAATRVTNHLLLKALNERKYLVVVTLLANCSLCRVERHHDPPTPAIDRAAAPFCAVVTFKNLEVLEQAQKPLKVGVRSLGNQGAH